MSDTVSWPQKTRELRMRFVDSTIWNDFEFRNDDIIIATYPKAGTTWMQQIVGQLLFCGDPELAPQELSPWLDSRNPSKSEKLDPLGGQTHRRFIKTHLPVDALVFSPEARYIYVGRDGRDVLWSCYNHHLNFKPEVYERANSIEDYAGPLYEPPPADIRRYWREWMDRDGYPWFPFWDNVRGWWQTRTLPNVLFVHFANLKRDMPAEIRRIASFLGTAIDESRWSSILELCSFEWMKANAARVAPGGGAPWEGGAETFIHRGVNGRWTETLTPDESDEYESRAVEELVPECAHWLATGERSR